MGIISVNYYKEFMEKIYDKLEKSLYEELVWFGACNVLPLICDYLAADGYCITAVLDNDQSKWGKTIERNWCMPFTFGYIEISKEAVDQIVAGRMLPKLYIMSPEEFIVSNNMKNILFMTSSYRSDEIVMQLVKMGVNLNSILVLETEGAMWEKACQNIYSHCIDRVELSNEERKEILKEILEQFVCFCDEKGLRYYLAYGTLIGAVRHKGFIPWDDDIDVLMPVEDYRRLLEEYKRNGPYEVLSIVSDIDYFFPFAKIVDNRTYLHHHGFPITWMQGMYIDIFPMSGFEDNVPFEEQWIKQTLLDIEWYWYCVAKDVIHKKMEDCRERILNTKFKISFDKAHEVGCLTTIPATPWILDKSVFGNGCNVYFEGKTYKAPVGYDTYLKKVYGNYMKVPPVEEQKIHGFPAYRKI